MRAMRYMIQLKEGLIPEMSIYADNYQNKKLFVFINQIDGAFLFDFERGSKRLELVDKETAEVFDISVDNYLILDLMDALNNVNHDVNILMKRYFKADIKKVNPNPIQEEKQEVKAETKKEKKKKLEEVEN